MRRRTEDDYPTRSDHPLRRRSRRLPILLLLVPLLVGLIGAPSAGPVAGDELSDAIARQRALEQQIKNQQAQVARLKNQQASLKSDIAGTQKALSGINADLAAVKSRINTISASIAETKATHESLVKELETLDTQLARLVEEEARKREELRERMNLLAERIRVAYDTDRTSLLETFLSGGTFTDVIAEVSYNLDVADQDRALAEQISRDRETLAAIHGAVASTRGMTNTLRQETEVQRIELEARMVELKTAQEQLRKLERETAHALASQRATFNKLAQTEEQLRKSIAAAAAAQKQLRDRINRLVREQASKGRIPSKYNGSLSWPMSGRITQNFGCTGFKWEPPLGDCAHFHKGIDIAAPMYTPIRAAAPGRVVFAGANPYDRHPKAWIVIIAHSSNLVTWYAHVDNAAKPPAVRSGQWVNGGQVIAYNGLTGRTTGPHLHWMVEFNGKFVNPRLFL